MDVGGGLSCCGDRDRRGCSWSCYGGRDRRGCGWGSSSDQGLAFHIDCGMGCSGVVARGMDGNGIHDGNDCISVDGDQNEGIINKLGEK